ncbi:UNVERIFIED_CONTAM: hypothetical protein FKN15_047155, partial [Acipenser sinensis]
KELTSSITSFIAKEMLPLDTVEKSGFRKMLPAFDHQYEFLGRKYFSKTAIPELYIKVRVDVAEQVQRADYLSATTDMWLSKNRTPFMSLTIHFISPEWKLESRCLQTRVLSEDRRHQHLALTWQDISVLEGVNSALKPVVKFTDILSGENYVTVSSVHPLLQHLKTVVLHDSLDDTTLTVDSLDAKYIEEGMQKLLLAATFLDPRYRGDQIDHLEETKHRLMEEMTAIGQAQTLCQKNPERGVVALDTVPTDAKYIEEGTQKLLLAATFLDLRYRGDQIDHLEETKHRLMEEGKPKRFVKRIQRGA